MKVISSKSKICRRCGELEERLDVLADRAVAISDENTKLRESLIKIHVDLMKECDCGRSVCSICTSLRRLESINNG